MTEVRGRVRAEPGQKRVRAFLAGRLVADTRRPLLVWEKPWYPTYYLPVADVAAELVPTGATERAPSRGDGRVHDLRVGDHLVTGAAVTFPDSPLPALREHVRIAWGAVDAWFEEDEQVFVHPRDPYKRVDILPSSRHVVVETDGQVVAESRRPTLLFETGLIVRTYLPPVDVRRDLLVPSDTVTRCPYKGTADYFHLRAGEIAVDDVAWSYPFPTPESARIAGLLAFHDEKVDVIVDGDRRPRPATGARTDA